MFKAIDVWKRLDNGTLLRYRCFQVIQDDRYCVQSVDSYTWPLNVEQIIEFDKQYIELLQEEAPDARTETYETIEEAISKFDEDFEEFGEL